MATEIVVHLATLGSTATSANIRSHRVIVDRPETKGGADLGPMGGELLLAALGGCFASNLFAALAGRGIDVRDIGITVTGTLADAPSRFEAIQMEVAGEADDPAGFAHVVSIAERGCIVANTLRSDVSLGVHVQHRGEVG